MTAASAPPPVATAPSAPTTSTLAPGGATTSELVRMASRPSKYRGDRAGTTLSDFTQQFLLYLEFIPQATDGQKLALLANFL
eukprot:jgi/Hompol1/4254/HPOL_007013-RA